MCGRFIMIPKDELNRIIADVKRNLASEASANVRAAHEEAYPKSKVPIILPRVDRLEVAVMQFGFERAWHRHAPRRRWQAKYVGGCPAVPPLHCAKLWVF